MASSKAITSSTKVHNGLLPTPPMPKGLPKANLTDNARQVLMKRYVRRGDDGKPAETVEEMFWRVAYHVAKVEEQWEADVQKRTVEYYHLLSSKKFFPNSPTFTGAGTPLGQLAACFVLKITDDMGRDSAGIFQTLRDAALIQQTGGGNGFSFSRLRPKGSMVKTSAGQATGPVGFLRVYDHAFGEIAQGGCLLPETLVFTSKGLLRLDEIVNSNVSGWQEHVLSVPTDEGWKESPRGYNNGVADVLRVHTRQGLSITGTPNHKVKVMTDHGPQWKEIQDLAKGDWILVRLGEHTGKLQVLKKPVQEHANQVMPNLPSLLDEEFAFFLGYLAGNGFVAQGENDHRLGVSVAHTSYLMEEMPVLLGRLFNVKIHKMQKLNDGSATFVIDNRAVKDFLVMNGLGKRTSREVSVPRLIRQSPPNIVGAYLRGLFEADGALLHGYPTLMTTSTQLAREVATLLIGLGCPVGIRTVSPGLDHWGEAQTYQIRITSTVGLQAWREKIGCDQRSRFVAAYAWESDQRRESSYILPNPKYWLQPILDAVTLEQIDKKGRGRNINFRATEPYLRRQILRYYREERNLTRSGYDLLRAAHPAAFENVPSVDGFWFVKVDGVESVGQSLTLDLEVADNHTYLAYGMVTHNTRRGANMGVLRVDHPDVEEFIECKTNENHITNFNISVGITDAFMRAVKNDEEWELRFPDLWDVKEKGFNGTLEQAEAAGIKINSYKKVPAREIFNKIVKQAHHNGEPGVLFLDAANRANPVPHLYQLEATNPCGEQYLGSYENCCLGSVNLNEHCGPDGTVDWELLRQSVVLATRFLDDVVEANAYVPAVPQLKEAAHRARRIGLGIMGLADLMYHVGVRYGSPQGQAFGAQVMEFVRYHALKTSIELAEERGPFPAIDGSIYDMDNVTWTPPQSLVPFENRWDRPEVQWDAIMAGIRKHGIRNAAQTTVAPTGCLIPGTLVTTDYGLLPIEALGNTRGEQWQDIDLQVSSEGGVLPATKFYINGSAHTLRVVTRRGYTLQGTDHHRLRVLEHGEWVWKRLDELKAGMRVPLQMSGLIGKPRRVLLDASLATNFHPVTVKLPEEMTPELAYLVGFFMGDGSLKDRSLRFSVSDERLQHHIPSLLKKVFGVSAEAYTDKRSSCLISLELHSVNIVEFWKNNGFAKQKPFEEHQGKGYLPHIPLAILRTNDAEIYGAFLAGLFDADGTSHNGRLLTWVSTDRQFHDQIKAMLFALGILTTSDVQRTGKSNMPIHRLRVSHTQSANRLRRQLPYLVRLSFETSSVRRATLGDTIPITEGEYQSVLALAESGAEEQRVWGWRQRGLMASRESLGNFVERHRQAMEEAGLDRLTDVVENEIYFDEVVTIEDGGVQDTYDISVPDTHAYIANGFISHNTIATVAGCEGYGCEPVFALAYIRHVNDNGKDLQLTYASPRFEEALKKIGLGEEKRQEIVEQVMRQGTCQQVKDIPQSVRDVFVVSSDITAEEHVRMQAVLQAFSDNSLSKTVNFPETATEEDVAKAYMLAWELGCKGITVYVTGSREKVVLETKATAEKKDVASSTPAAPLGASQPKPELASTFSADPKKPRPRVLSGKTYNVETPVGKAFITINENGGEQPFEAFINTAKAGSETAAVSEAIGRLISYILRMVSPTKQTDRLREVVRQLMGIGGGRSLGMGPNRVRSLPDGIGQVLDMYLRQKANALPVMEEKSNPPSGGGNGGSHHTLEEEAMFQKMKVGDLCPECGEAAVVNEEGCRKCYACGYSEC